MIPKRPGVFMDRDGVLSRNVVRDGEPRSPRLAKDFEIFPDLEKQLAELSGAGYYLFAVTNQPDISRGGMASSELEAMHLKLMASLGPHGLRKIYVCPHDDRDQCRCRKPKPGMILEAAAEWNIDLVQSFMIGDRLTDISAGRQAGCRTILIQANPGDAPQSDYTARDLPDACRMILALTKSKPEKP